MYLFFDTETTGLPKNYQAPLDDFLNWPRLVQLAWSIYDFDGHHWESKNYLVKPDGFLIPQAATAIHRISQERAEQEGAPLLSVLQDFLADAQAVDYLVAHNFDFDEKILGAEFLRTGLKSAFPQARKICTMKASAPICRLPGGRGAYKWPNLSELYFYLFTDSFPEAHDAAFDVRACADCFFELKRKRLI